MKTLGGSTFCWRGIDQDYNFLETLECLYDLCDQVSIAFGGHDGTVEAVRQWALNKRWDLDGKLLHTYIITEEEWKSQVGREKLSYFSNIAIQQLTTDYNLYCQCDEVVHQDAEPHIRAAIETDHEAFFMRRLNLWKDPNHMLNVSQDRKPCSTEVIRLAKTKYRCIDDAESLNPTECFVFGDIDLMTIYHLGFIRNPVKMLVKVKHMLTEVFGWSNDTRAENCEKFEPSRFFSDDDITSIPKPLPSFCKVWCQDRFPDLELIT